MLFKSPAKGKLFRRYLIIIVFAIASSLLVQYILEYKMIGLRSLWKVVIIPAIIAAPAIFLWLNLRKLDLNFKSIVFRKSFNTNGFFSMLLTLFTVFVCVVWMHSFPRAISDLEEVKNCEEVKNKNTYFYTVANHTLFYDSVGFYTDDYIQWGKNYDTRELENFAVCPMLCGENKNFSKARIWIGFNASRSFRADHD